MALLLLTNRVLIRHLPQHSKNLSLSEEQTNSEPTDAENESPSSAVETDQADMMENTILVAYFFAAGTTEQIVQQAAQTSMKSYPIPRWIWPIYTDGRADQEQDDHNSHPSITGGVEDMSQYDTVLFGYPIWHGQARKC